MPRFRGAPKTLSADKVLCLQWVNHEMSDKHDDHTAKQGKRIAIVIAAAAILSVLTPEIVKTVELEPRHEIWFYMISLAAFFWALVVTFKLWQKTRK